MGQMAAIQKTSRGEAQPIMLQLFAFGTVSFYFQMDFHSAHIICIPTAQTLIIAVAHIACSAFSITVYHWSPTDEFPNLGQYCERMKDEFWPDWDECITHGNTRKATK